MSNLFGLNKPNTNLRKNVFDLSEKTLYSQSCGQLIPVMCRELNPGEKVQFSMSAFTRTQPLNTAAYVRCRQYYHVFFVPFKQLWSGWDNFIYGVDYKTSALQKSKKYKNVPRFELYKVLYKLFEDGYLLGGLNSDQRNSHRAYDEHGYEYYLGVSRMLDMLGYGMYSNDEQLVLSSLSDLVKAILSKIEAIRGLLAVPTQPRVNYTDSSSSRSTSTPKDRHRSIYDDPKYIDVLREGLEEQINTHRSAILAHLAKIKDYNHSVNPFRFLAYQKIYSDFYKRDDYEATDPLSFNIDDFDGSIAIDGTVNAERLLSMLRVRYRWLPKDYFTGIVPSELFGTLNDDLSTLVSGFGGSIVSSNNGTGVAIPDSVGINEFVSTKSIRSAFAIEKLLRLTRRAGGHDYISQTASHYGFEPPKGRGDKVEFLGGYSSTINISEVVTSANGFVEDSRERMNASVGQIFGKGIGSLDGGKEIEYTAKEHGIFMCISSVVPELDYSSEGLNAFNTKFQRGDYFQPEFQDLGLQPVYSHELRNDFAGYANDGSSILGFVPRYAEYKTAYDTLHGEFRNGRTMSAWSASQMVDYGELQYRTGSGIRVNSLKINPKCLDRITSTNFNGSEATDQFLVQAQFICKVIRPMSITGQSL